MIPAPTADVAVIGGGTLRTRGHDRAVSMVRAMIAGRVPHAILLSGPAGIGKTTLALDLAAGLLCDDADPGARPCRACRGCRLVERGRHPDVHRLAPAGPGDQIRIGARDRPDDGTVRRLASDLVLLPVEGGARVAILERADRMTDDAQTALLKTLEEPPAGVTIILCADDEDRLLPTVRSRAARIRLGPVATREIEAMLAESGVADPPAAARLARLAGGRPGTAWSFARAPEAIAARDEIARTLLDLLTATPAPRLAGARGLTTLATTLARALDRVVADARSDGPDGAGIGTAKRGRGRPRGPASSAGRASGLAGTAGAATAASDGPTGADGAADEDDDVVEDAAAGRTAVPAAERRRAASILVGLWRELTRDLLIVLLGEERQVRDPGLLDELRPVADQLGASASDGRAALGSFLRRLDAAGELLEANVRPELVLDTLLLRWPSAVAPSAVAPSAVAPSAASSASAGSSGARSVVR